jgi:flagellar secretion chaperone FliS
MYAQQHGRYLENEVMSRSREWLVPLLYEHLLKRLARAGVQMDEGDIEGRTESLIRANDIVLELAASLNVDEGGPLVQQLSALYGYFALQIMDINRTLDRGALEKLISLVSELHEAWAQAAEQVAPRGGSARVTRVASA